LAKRSTNQLLAADAGGDAIGAAPEEPVEPVLPLDGLLMGEEEEPGVVVASPTFLPQAPSASAAVRASAVTAMKPNLLSCMSISFQEWKRDQVLVSETPIYLPGGFSP
jgi:hypothetical protein